jgi:hypothetical protein
MEWNSNMDEAPDPSREMPILIYEAGAYPNFMIAVACFHFPTNSSLPDDVWYEDDQGQMHCPTRWMHLTKPRGT